MFSGENKYYTPTNIIKGTNLLYQLEGTPYIITYCCAYTDGVGKYDVQKGHDWTQKQGDGDGGLGYKRVDRYGWPKLDLFTCLMYCVKY